MKKTLIQDDVYLRTVIDALPSAVFVVDHAFDIFDLNPAAAKLFRIDSDTILRRLCGEIMHCMHAIESEGGCGSTKFCPDCVIRNSVEAACKGQGVHQKRHRMKIQNHGYFADVHMLVSASPFNYKDEGYALLVVEDITEVIMLKRLLPICSNCKKIRNDEDYWEQVADYLHKHANLEFTHSICPECAKILYPDP